MTQHNTSMLNLTSKFSGFDSLCPPSSPSTDSEVEYPPHGLRASIAAIPDSKLRSIMIKLAESSPPFHRAIMKELGRARCSGESPPSTPTTPTTPKIRNPERRRSKAGSHHKNISAQTPIHEHKPHMCTESERLCQSDCVYHPGNLEEEVYEFLSTPDDTIQEVVVRTLTMWSCCDEDEWSPGCMSVTMVPAQYKIEPDDRYEVNLSHDDVFPDSDLEERLDLSSRLRSQRRWSAKHL